MKTKKYGYNDPELYTEPLIHKKKMKWVAFALAVLFIFAVWFSLNQKLLFGKDWLSETYDNDDWRTNEGNLHTYGAWDLENHIWKTEYIMDNFPYFNWNPYWYLGMPILKYYQPGFYIFHWLTIALTGLSAARASLILIIFSHLLATLLTFLLCYKVSKRIWVSAFSSIFLLSSTFITLRSYGWEPITVVFLFLYPVGLLLFLQEPLKPFRFWLILAVSLAYLTHPLLWFSLCMTMGIYLFSIAIRRNHRDKQASQNHYIWQFIAIVFISILLGAVQFFPQITYHQATSGAHMGVKYLPFYQVPPNIITLKDFFFDAGNLKGPGPIIMIAFFLLIIFTVIGYKNRHNVNSKKLHKNELISGLTLVLFMMVLFYYMEFYNIFPMNLLRSIQYHRIIPEFIITAAVLVAAMSNVVFSKKQKIMYYAMLMAFVLASGIIIYNVQGKWLTVSDISNKDEFLKDQNLFTLDKNTVGRITFPYTDQSLAVRNSFTFIPQTYGYYEQGITNSYNDEIFSVSSGYHNANLTILYLKAANVGRLYVNMEEGTRDEIMRLRLNNTLPFVKIENSRYSYFEITLKDPSFVQAVDGIIAKKIMNIEPGCRIIYKVEYCGSIGEEFVSIDDEELAYISEYVNLLEMPYPTKAKLNMVNPDNYEIEVKNANKDAGIVVKMTYDRDFIAKVNGYPVPIEKFGPDFMLISPNIEGDYMISLTYNVSRPILVGGVVSILTLIVLILYFLFGKSWNASKAFNFTKGDM